MPALTASAKGNSVFRLRKFMMMGWVKNRALAIDGGANLGVWSVVLAQHFKRVLAFEPTPETFGLMVKNVKNFKNIECRREALMDKAGTISMKKPAHTDALKARFVEWDSDGAARSITIDSLNLPSCGLIKLDLEGAEALALDGATETIARCRPALAVEIQHSARFGIEPESIHQKVLDMGYREVFRDGQDRFYVPREQA